MTSSRVVGIRSITVACVLLAFTLAASLGMAALTPGNAYAGSKTSVYVVTKAVYKSGDYKTTLTYSYKNGLITKVAGKHVSDADTFTTTNKFTYNSKNALTKQAYTYNGKPSYKVTFTTNSKGWVTKKSVKYEGSQAHKTKYTYKSGKLVKEVDDYSTRNYTYDSKGRLKSAVYKNENGEALYKDSYAYDKHGIIKKAVDKELKTGNTYTMTYKNTYKNGRLAKKVSKYNGKYSETVTLTYKKVSVPKSVKKMVEAQQLYTISVPLPLDVAHK